MLRFLETELGRDVLKAALRQDATAYVPLARVHNDSLTMRPPKALPLFQSGVHIAQIEVAP
jgi:hypothetical protein